MRALVIAASLLATLCLSQQVEAQEHGHVGDVVRHHVPYSRLRLFAEGDFDIDTSRLQDDEAIAMQAWVQAIGPLWFGLGLSGIGSIGRMAIDSHHPNMGLMVDLSAMLDLRDIETQFRFYLEHEWGEHELTLLRFDWRATTHSLASPIVRVVLDHVPEGWDQSHPHSARWSVTPSAGVMLNLFRQHGHPMLALAFLLGWHPPSIHDTSWTQFHPGIIFEYRVR